MHLTGVRQAAGAPAAVGSNREGRWGLQGPRRPQPGQRQQPHCTPRRAAGEAARLLLPPERQRWRWRRRWGQGGCSVAAHPLQRAPLTKANALPTHVAAHLQWQQRQRWPARRHAAAADGGLAGSGEQHGADTRCPWGGPLGRALANSRLPDESCQQQDQQLGGAMRQQDGIQPPAAWEAQQQGQQAQGHAHEGRPPTQQPWWRRWQPRWQLPAVPWELNTTIVLMCLWGVWFAFAAYTLVPALLRWAGVQQSSSSASQAVRHLLLDTLQVSCCCLSGLLPLPSLPRCCCRAAAPLSGMGNRPRRMAPSVATPAAALPAGRRHHPAAAARPVAVPAPQPGPVCAAAAPAAPVAARRGCGGGHLPADRCPLQAAGVLDGD